MIREPHRSMPVNTTNALDDPNDYKIFRSLDALFQSAVKTEMSKPGGSARTASLNIDDIADLFGKKRSFNRRDFDNYVSADWGLYKVGGTYDRNNDGTVTSWEIATTLCEKVSNNAGNMYYVDYDNLKQRMRNE